MSSPWLPPVTVERDGWRVTPIWHRGDNGATCVGVTVLADPAAPQPLSRQALDALGEPPTKAVAAAWGMTVDSAYNLVVKLRRDGFLPPTTPGRAVA